MESKAVSNVHTLGKDTETTFRYWTDKIRNGLGQIDRRYREVLRWIERNTKKDEDIKGQGEVRSGVEGTIDWPVGWIDQDYESSQTSCTDC